MFTIGDISFDHSFGVLYAFWTGGCLEWGISIQGDRKERLFGEEWKPRAYSERLPNIRTAGIEDLSYQTSSWNNPYDESSGDRAAALCVFEHLDIRNSRLKFGQVAGATVPFAWTGDCDVLFDDNYARDIPIRIEATAKLAAVYTEYLNESAARRAITFITQGVNSSFVCLEHPQGRCLSAFIID